MIDFRALAEHSEVLFPNMSALRCSTAVPLDRRQTDKLVSQGCSSANWNLVKFTAQSDLDLVKNCCFDGEVSVHIPSGMLQGSSFKNCTIEGPLTVVSTGEIVSMTLLPGSKVEYCGTIRWDSVPGVLDAFINAGVETGQRRVPVIPHFDHADVAFLGSASGRSTVTEAVSFREILQNRLKGFIGRDACVSNCSCILNTVVMKDAVVDNATAVRGSILFEGASAVDGALVRNSVLQWNSRVDSLAVVESSIVGECAEVEKHGKLTDSFLGADSVLGEGEVTASVVGPLTGIHHQSLLIAAWWPGGRGNIGYGANIGSNHTSRLPDQEIRPGTGMFFGLSTSVKYPSDFSGSPFTVIATGLTTLPQRVSFPFSLITLPHKRPQGVPEGWYQLIPGWVLSDNLYSILRNQWKYANRLKAVHTKVETTVFSDEVLEMVLDAKQRLEESSAAAVPGAGKNYITEEDRLQGIEVYRKCLRAAELWKKNKAAQLNSGETGELLGLLRYARTAALSSREKDYTRGGRTIDDYLEVRKPMEREGFIEVLETWFAKAEAELKQSAPAS